MRALPLSALLLACSAPPPPEIPRSQAQESATHASGKHASKAAAPTANEAPPPPPPPADAIGTAHPLVIDAASPAGSWVVACQAREDTNGDDVISVEVGPRGDLLGDELQPYLIRGAGAGQPIDELMAVGPNGRWLVLREDGRVILLDATMEKEVDLTELGVDSRSDAIPYADHRALSFDGKGTKLAYVRDHGDKTVIVVRSLEDGQERIVDPGPGKVWRIALDMTGNWVAIEMITTDTSGNGRLGWPVPERKRLAPRCGGPLPRFAAWQDRGDEPATLVAPATGGRAKLMSSLVAPLRNRLLVRLPGGEIFLQTWKGKRTRMGGGTCLGHLVHADVDRELALFACEQEEGKPLLELRGPGYRHEFETAVTGQAVSVWPTSAPRLVPVYPGQDALLFDFAHRRAVALQTRDSVLLVDESRALVRRAENLVLVDVDADSELPLAALPQPEPDVIRQPPIVVVSPFVIDVRQGKVLGTVTGRPLAATRQGHVLVALGGDADADQLATGPLQWKRPQPISDPP